MPTYEYACSACGNAWEEVQRISAPALDTCPKCQEKTAKRQISGGSAFILKGGGWYSDLYSSSGNKKPAADAKSESKSETKTETKSETKSSDSSSTAAPAATPAPKASAAAE
jgi:putative FmdB family regulatory protein